MMQIFFRDIHPESATFTEAAACMQRSDPSDMDEVISL